SVTDAEAQEPQLQRHVSLDLGTGITLQFDVSPFQPERHKLSWCTSGGWKRVCSLDGRPYFGSDGEVPYAQLYAAVVKYGSHVVHLDVSGMFNPWVGAPNRSLYTSKNTGDGYKVFAAFSDGAGAYLAEWKVTGDGALRTSLQWAEEGDDEPSSDEKET